MSQQEKGDLFRKLKAAGVEFSKHYRDYTTDELKAGAAKLAEEQPELAVRVGLINPPPGEEMKPPEPPAADVPPDFDKDALAQAYEAMTHPTEQPGADRMPTKVLEQPEVRAADPEEMPGQRLNQSVELEPIRTDEQGRVWFQEMVLKPAYPKPRGRRVLQYMDGGVETRTVREGEFVETFEVAGVANRRPAEIKITLPSYQVGIYKDPRFPFKVHVYASQQGFDLFEVQNYYGGAELVPSTIKRIYVENVLCYDIRTTVRAIQTEFNQLRLQGRI